MPESPLNEQELRILRGMIDQYEYGRARSRMFASWAKDTGKLLAILGGFTLIALNVVQVVLALMQGH